MDRATDRRTMSRRGLLGAGIGLVAGAGTFSVFTSATRARAQDEYELVLRRYAELLAGPADADTSHPDIRATLESMTAKTEALLSQVVDADDRDRVFSNLPLLGEDSAPVQSTALDLSVMAQSWAAPGSPFQHDDVLGEVVVEGLRTLHALRYNDEQEEFGNWYHWEIGAPRGILEAATLVRQLLPAEVRTGITDAVAHFVPDPGFMYPSSDPRHKPSTGSNRLFLCQNVAIAAALAGKGDRIALASTTAVQPLQLVETGEGDGLYFDGSFIAHDNIPYTGTYGRALLTASSYLLAVTGGTRWELPSDSLGSLQRTIARTYFPWVSSGQTLPPVCGRAVANGNLDAAWMMGSILLLAEGAPPEVARLWHGWIKGQLERATEVDFFRRRTLPEALLAQRLLASDVEGRPEDLGPRLFPEMDRVLARGPGWCVSLATASKRTRGYETMSGENVKGWHQGSAARYLHLESDQRHYLDWFPTVDPFRMPGTTIDSQFLDEERNSAPTYHGFVGGSQVGGTRLDDGFYDRPLYAAWVQQLSSRDSTMTAKLSWFFLGDLIVCLGADIRGGSGNPIETILENRAITNAATQRLFVDGEYVPEAAEPGWSTTVQQLESFTIDGVASVIAFGGPLTVHLLHEERTGSWSDISARGSTEPHTKRFVTGWLDHGSRPAGAAFSYLYAPLVGAARATELAADPGVELLRNDAEVQGVWSPSRGVTCVNFHREDTVRAGQSTILGAKETSVSLLHRGNGVLEIAVSAPCQLRTRRRFTIGFPNGWDLAVGHTDATLEVTRRGSEFDIVLDSSALDGRSHHLELVRS